MIVRHFDGIVAWAQTRQTNGFMKPSMACFKLPSARCADTPASKPCELCCSSSQASSTSRPSTHMPRKPH
ncbi:hypothetical protein LMG28140_01668 [Paraburkholderia metrosideri]|uniref:Uncharacterized protein n=1 Tax=Paraburkholderia metrosideri TaxID=580937 RepID=A0ABN7HKQ1_9BURK|nr:hypothetical protein LMG28140_01668 [Paraburkholderia metrosideri]